MTVNRNGPRYEDAAEHIGQITGWVCKTCRRYFGEDENGARWCCAGSLPCECGGRITGSYTCCDECRRKKSAERYAALPEEAWNFDSPLALWDDDRFFFSSEDLADYLGNEDLTLDDVRLVLCEQNTVRGFEALDYFSDDLGEDGADQISSKAVTEINAIVDAWAKDNLPALWHGRSARPTRESIAHIEADA